MRVKPHGPQVWGKKEKLGLGKCHLRKSFYFAILSINSFFSIVQMNTWCVFYHSIQGKFHWTPSWTRIRKKLLFLKDHVGFVKICNSSTSTVSLAKTSGHIASNPFLQEIRHTKRDPPNKKQKGTSSIRCFATRDPLLLWTLVTPFADTEFSFTVLPKTTYLGNTIFLLGESSKTFE